MCEDRNGISSGISKLETLPQELLLHVVLQLEDPRPMFTTCKAMHGICMSQHAFVQWLVHRSNGCHALALYRLTCTKWVQTWPEAHIIHHATQLLKHRHKQHQTRPQKQLRQSKALGQHQQEQHRVTLQRQGALDLGFTGGQSQVPAPGTMQRLARRESGRGLPVPDDQGGASGWMPGSSRGCNIAGGSAANDSSNHNGSRDIQNGSRGRSKSTKQITRGAARGANSAGPTPNAWQAARRAHTTGCNAAITTHAVQINTSSSSSDDSSIAANDSTSTGTDSGTTSTDIGIEASSTGISIEVTSTAPALTATPSSPPRAATPPPEPDYQNLEPLSPSLPQHRSFLTASHHTMWQRAKSRLLYWSAVQCGLPQVAQLALDIGAQIQNSDIYDSLKYQGRADLAQLLLDHAPAAPLAPTEAPAPADPQNRLEHQQHCQDSHHENQRKQGNNSPHHTNALLDQHHQQPADQQQQPHHQHHLPQNEQQQQQQRDHREWRLASAISGAVAGRHSEVLQVLLPRLELLLAGRPPGRRLGPALTTCLGMYAVQCPQLALSMVPACAEVDKVLMAMLRWRRSQGMTCSC